MYRGFQYLTAVLITSTLALAMIIGGCAGRASYRVYDTDHGDYHQWNNNEVVYYQQWEVETKRPHQDFRKRNPDEQKEYWNWRHNHSDHH